MWSIRSSSSNASPARRWRRRTSTCSQTDQRDDLFRRCGRILRRIEAVGFSHFDSKASNWIVMPDDLRGPDAGDGRRGRRALLPLGHLRHPARCSRACASTGSTRRPTAWRSARDMRPSRRMESRADERGGPGGSDRRNMTDPTQHPDHQAQRHRRRRARPARCWRWSKTLARGAESRGW